MCGITGIVAPAYDADRLRSDLEGAVESLAHRGPDDRGTWTAAGVGLGHTRLTILDLTSAGHQPKISADGRLVMVFNGEIYNYVEIREELVALGHGFISTGDTEVILTAFGQWGADAVHRFIGMFALALWDTQERTLTLLRDRVGVKPLYYGWSGGSLWFGSELKSLRAYHHWTPAIDRNAVGEFCHYGYIAGARTVYQNVRKLEPAHMLTLAPGKEPVVQRYWSPVPTAGEVHRGSEGDIERELEELMTSAFGYRMVSDVPVGVYLSGGVDSSVVTALLAKASTQQLRTFTIGFDDPTHDESAWARRVADHLGTQHTEYTLGVREALDLARDWGTLFDEPFGDVSGLPTLLVSRLAAREVKVVLSADGGDELFGGYTVYDDVLERLDRLESVPGSVRSAAGKALRGVSVRRLENLMHNVPVPSPTRGLIARRLRRSRAVLNGATPAQVYDAAIAYWMPEEIETLMQAYTPMRQQMDVYPGSPVEQMCLWDFHHYLPEDVLTKVDRSTMAVSIEGRDPMIDHRLVEYAYRLPLSLRRGALGPKHIVKKILYRHVPRELVDRPKRGFSVPLESWLRTDMKELVRDHLEPQRIAQAGIFDAHIVTRTVDDFYSGNPHVTSQLWFLLAFEMWRERWG